MVSGNQKTGEHDNRTELITESSSELLGDSRLAILRSQITAWKTVLGKCEMVKSGNNQIFTCRGFSQTRGTVCAFLVHVWWLQTAALRHQISLGDNLEGCQRRPEGWNSFV